MNAFDLFCLVLVLAFGIWGAFRGLLRQIFGLIGFVGGIVLARLLAQSFGDAFAKDLGLPVAVATAAMAIALLRPHLQHLETETCLAKLDLPHSHVLSVAREVNLITELRGPRKT